MLGLLGKEVASSENLEFEDWRVYRQIVFIEGTGILEVEYANAETMIIMLTCQASDNSGRRDHFRLGGSGCWETTITYT
jgi:hypothetical protein